jgi:hypothetical protein
MSLNFANQKQGATVKAYLLHSSLTAAGKLCVLLIIFPNPPPGVMTANSWRVHTTVELV